MSTVVSGARPETRVRDGLGDSTLRPDGTAKVRGEFAFTSDLHAEGLLWGRTLRSPHAAARIRSIDVTAARLIPGVRAVVTAEDVPGSRFYGLDKPDQPVFAWEVIRYAGEPVAAVAADHPESARLALDAIAVDYEPLDGVFDAEAALTAAPIHPNGNLYRRLVIRRGDPDATGEVVVEGVYEVGMQDQAFMGPESGLAIPTGDGGVDLYISTQWLHVDRDQVAACLDLPLEKVRLVLGGVGGAFGAREDVSLQVHVCLLALRTGRPVRMVYSREESFHGHVHRHPARMWMRHHARADGTLVKVEARLVLDGGAYQSSSHHVIANATCFAAGPYVVPNVALEGIVVRTNNPSCGAMRGFGAVQSCFAHESQMDKVAAACGVDPYELRLRNAMAPGDRLATGQVVEGTLPVRECLEAAAALALPPPAVDDWLARPGGVGRTTGPGDARRGVGWAVGFKNLLYAEGSDDFSTARCRLQDGFVELTCAAAEVGQGFVTLAGQIARTVLGVERVVLGPAATAGIGSAGSTSASRQTWMSGGAVEAACMAVRAQLLAHVGAGTGHADLEIVGDRIRSRDGRVDLAVAEAAPGVAFEATEEFHHRLTHPLDDDGQGDAHVSLVVAAHRAVVDVDRELGLVKVVQVATGQDVGRALNPLSVQGQIEGGIAQGVGLAVMEEMVLDHGRIRNPSFTDYLIPTALDMPEVVATLVEQPEPGAPFGAKGVGEPPTVSSHAAVVAAIRAATGLDLTRCPVRPQDIALAVPSGPSGDAVGAPGMTTVETGVVSFRLNGRDVAVRADHPHLLAALREELDVTSPKDGCSPSGQCGCCTILIDGKAQVSCQYPVARAEGRQVLTLEGVAEEERQRFADAFAACGGLQCGFCIPGIVMRAKAQIDKKGADLAREDMARHLGAHLCRCTGYVKVLDAIEAVARATPVDPHPPGGIGTRGAKYEAASLTLGDRGYVDDLRVPGLLHAALHLTAHTRADIVAIDTAAALAAPGVVRVLTAADIPGDLRVGIIHHDWPVMIPVGGRTSYAGDVLAVVVAETRQAARAAAGLVEVTYGVHPPVTDPDAALVSGEIAVWGTDSNVLSRSAYQRGDVDAELAACAHVVEQQFRTQRIEHAFLEPEATLALPRADGGLHVYSGGQGVWDDRDQIAAVLGVGRDRVTVELVSNGGAFGGKEDMANQAQTALAAWLLGRPVKCVLSREESFRIHAKRHPIRMIYTAGCDAEGRLRALRVRMVGDSGAYASVGMKVLERAAGHASGPYRVPAIDVESVAVRTNNPVCGAFRGFGANQAQFAMEGVLDRLAERVGITGWEIRKRNVIHPGEVWGPGQVMDDGCAGAEACLDAIRSRYDEAHAAGKAVGLGLGLKNSGLGNGFKEITGAVVRFEEDGTVEVRHGWTEMGQGVHTVALQVAVEELGVDPARVRVVVDTTRELGLGQTTGSRGTLMGAGAVRDACRAALEGGCRTGIDYVGEYRVDWTQHLGDVENPTIHSAFGYATQMVVMDPATQVIERVVAVHDVGRAVNPRLCEGQIEGAVHMGLGYALTEDFGADESGFPVKRTLRSLGILRAKDVPPIEVVLIEVPQPRAPYGIKGVGEIGLVPTAGAVAAALHAADGRWRDTLPMGADGPDGDPDPAG